MLSAKAGAGIEKGTEMRNWADPMEWVSHQQHWVFIVLEDGKSKLMH